MSQEILNIVLAGVSIIVTGLASALVVWIKQWINTKIKDKKIAQYSSQLTDIIYNCVNEVSQTYVDELKKEGKFNKEAQKIALAKCLEKVKSVMTSELKEWVEETYGDFETFITTLIESTVHNFK